MVRENCIKKACFLLFAEPAKSQKKLMRINACGNFFVFSTPRLKDKKPNPAAKKHQFSHDREIPRNFDAHQNVHQYFCLLGGGLVGQKTHPRG